MDKNQELIRESSRLRAEFNHLISDFRKKLMDMKQFNHDATESIQRFEKTMFPNCPVHEVH